MKSLFRISALSVAMSLSGLASATAETLRVGTEGAYAPFNSVSQDGAIEGFDVDIGNAICAVMEVECEWSVHDWGGIIPALNANKFDFMVASMAITPARQKAVIFTDPYYYNAMRFVKLKDVELDDAKPETLKGLTIGAQQGAVSAKVLDDWFADSDIKLFPKLGEALMDLESGRIDLVLASQFAIGDWMNDGVDCCEFVGESFLMDGTVGAGIAFRKDDAELQARVNKALKTIMDNGTYDEIRKKYFEFDIMSKPGYVSELFNQ
ncbi:transporter substrate-binding domain-containing protein [Stappia taiwanensis]|uniref:Transporter substrate-binding domain-containing protein n=1 Tax=Stappia taiwanensis TaxID=992267 RepID=A0A838XRQ7_9HYPH|nr:transporter substrate-binding domain-containing protein [Stappia taiwanensis]MBA4613919.1 transporter substrate-binding domain-containing protein [Stappia taiwanensis]